MNRIKGFALLLALIPAAAPAQKSREVNRPVGHDRHRLEIEQTKAERYVNGIARCLAGGNKKRAQAALALPFNSPEQAAATDKMWPTDGQSHCFGPISGEMQLQFPYDAMVSGMAEHFILKQFNAGAVATLTPEQLAAPDRAPRNSTEEFGQCVVSQNPVAVHAIVKAEIGSEDERAAIKAVTPLLGLCVPERQRMALSEEFLRRVLGVSLYRLIGLPVRK